MLLAGVVCLAPAAAEAWPPSEREPLPLRLDEAPELPLLAPFRDPKTPPATFAASYRLGPWGKWRYRVWYPLDAGAEPPPARDLGADAWIAHQLEVPIGFPFAGEGDKAHWFVTGARPEPLSIDDALVPPWLRRLDPRWAAVLVSLAGCGRGGPCSRAASFPGEAFVALWTELAPLAFPIPEWQCKERPTSIHRIGSEKSTFLLLRCDGSIADGALAELSILARPTDAARVDALPDEPDPRAPAGEWVPGVHLVDPRMLWLLARVSDHFRWKAIYIYSGYRPRKGGEAARDPASAPPHASLHATGRALDIAVDGVDNEELLKLCFDLPDTGCGYYPHNKFVHIDVRPRSSGSSVWVDASGPGEPSVYVDSWTGVVAGGRVVWKKP